MGSGLKAPLVWRSGSVNAPAVSGLMNSDAHRLGGPASDGAEVERTGIRIPADDLDPFQRDSQFLCNQQGHRCIGAGADFNRAH